MRIDQNKRNAFIIGNTRAENLFSQCKFRWFYNVLLNFIEHY